MCNAFSCLVLKSREVIWQLGIDSHDQLVEMRRLRDNTDDLDRLAFARCEISPKNGSYLKPDKWVFLLDEGVKPTWWTDSYEKAAWAAWEVWKGGLYKILKVQKIINPLKIKSPKITQKEIDLLYQWASVRDSVRDSVWASVGDSVGASVGDSVWASVRASVGASVRDSVWASVRASVGASVRDSVWASVGDSVGASVEAYIGSFFILSRKAWKYTEKIEGEDYPFQPAVDFWKKGLVASYDGKIWRLHGGPKMGILYEEKIEGKK